MGGGAKEARRSREATRPPGPTGAPTPPEAEERTEGRPAEDQEAEEEGEQENELDGYTVAEAQELIIDTYDRALLERWKAQDSRVGVKNSIDKQLEAIKSEGAKGG